MHFKLSVFFLAASCCAQNSLTQYLTLSPAQVSAILKLNNDFGNYAFTQDGKASSLQSQLADLLQSPSPDPLSAGTVAASLELIRRDRIAKQSILQSNISAQLSAAQATLIRSLIDTVELQPLASDAACAYLTAPASGRWFDSTYYQIVTIPTAAQRSGDFMVPSAPTASFCNSPVFPISIREYFALSDAQIAAIFQASAAYNDFYLRSQNQLNDLNQQIQSAYDAGNADPVSLGLLYVAKNTISGQLTDRDRALRTAAQSQLTPAQQFKLKSLQDAVSLNNSNLAYAALSCNLLILPAGSSVTGTMLTGSISYCSL